MVEVWALTLRVCQLPGRSDHRPNGPERTPPRPGHHLAPANLSPFMYTAWAHRPSRASGSACGVGGRHHLLPDPGGVRAPGRGDRRLLSLCNRKLPRGSGWSGRGLRSAANPRDARGAGRGLPSSSCSGPWKAAAAPKKNPRWGGSAKRSGTTRVLADAAATSVATRAPPKETPPATGPVPRRLPALAGRSPSCGGEETTMDRPPRLAPQGPSGPRVSSVPRARLIADLPSPRSRRAVGQLVHVGGEGLGGELEPLGHR